MVLCECGEFVGRDKFKDYIKTSYNPSTETFGHTKCGFIFNFVDGHLHEIYSSKIKLKVIAKEFADEMKMNSKDTEKFLLAVDRLKRKGNLTDALILKRAYESVLETDPTQITECAICVIGQMIDKNHKMESK